VPVPEKAQQRARRADEAGLQRDHERLDVYELALGPVSVAARPAGRGARGPSPRHKPRPTPKKRARARLRARARDTNSGTRPSRG